MSQVIEYLPSKHETLNSTRSTIHPMQKNNRKYCRGPGELSAKSLRCAHIPLGILILGVFCLTLSLDITNDKQRFSISFNRE
jgi:hypothetical protein